MDDQEKHAGGRPSKFEDRYCQMLIDFMEQGYSFQAFAGKIGVGKATLYRWLDIHEKFRDARDIAFSKSEFFFETEGLKSMWQEHQGDKFSFAYFQMIMTNRFGYRLKPDTVVEIHDSFSLPKNLLPEE